MKSLNSVHLNGLRAVEAVARTGALQSAADELGVTPSAVSQHLARTEAQIGRTLFQRTRNGLVATEFGRQFSARLTDGFRELATALALATDDASNTLVVSVAPAFASRFLVPRMMRFYELHPEVLIRMDASTRLVDFDRSDINLGIRLGDGKWPHVRTEKLIDMDVFPVCIPEMARKLKTPADLTRAWVVSDSSTMISWENWFAAAGVSGLAMRQGVTFTDPMLCLDAVLAGHGVMLGWQMLAGDALADGRLVDPFGIRIGTGLAHYFVTPDSGREPRKVTLFKNWVRAQVEDATRCIAGRDERRQEGPA